MRPITPVRTTVTIGAALALAGGAAFASPASAATSTAHTGQHHVAELRIGEPAILGTLTVVRTEDVTGGDNPYILVNGERVWTSDDSINDGESREVNRRVKVGDKITVYDSDWPDGDDWIGDDFVDDQTSDLVFGLDGAYYTLTVRPG